MSLEESLKNLVAGDPAASAALIGAAYKPLIGHLMSNHARFGLDEDGAKDAALAALMVLIEQPERFDPGKGASVFGYLCMIADADVVNANRKRYRRQEIFSQYAVEVEEVGGKSYETATSTSLDARKIMDLHRDELIKDVGDAAVLTLLLDSERETDAYAEALGLLDLPAAQRAAAVKVRKDRMEARLKRIGKRYE